MTNFLHVLFDWDREETIGQILYFRLLEIVLLAQILFNVWKWSLYISDLNDVVLPLGLANYIDITVLFSSGLSFVNAGIISILLLTGFFRKWKFSYIIGLLFFHLQYVARYSQGEISHGSNLAGMFLLCIGLSFVFFKENKRIRKVSWGLIFFFVGLGYVSAALSKLIGTGFDWSQGEHLRMWIAERATDKLSQRGAFSLNWFQEMLLDHQWMATLTLTFGWLAEFLGFLLWFRKTRWIEATILLSMHIGIVFTLNIFFGDYVYLLILIGYPWDKVIDKICSKCTDSHRTKLAHLAG